jgi:hypothetical protein
MAQIELPDAKTNAGLEVRIFICETRKPHKPGYKLQEAILAMQYMDLVLYNRLISPGVFSAKGAETIFNIIKAKYQFQGFSNYPSLPSVYVKQLNEFMEQLNKGDSDYLDFYNAELKIANSNKRMANPSSGYLSGWVTHGKKIKGKLFHFFKDLQGNDFYWVEHGELD